MDENLSSLEMAVDFSSDRATAGDVNILSGGRLSSWGQMVPVFCKKSQVQ